MKKCLLSVAAILLLGLAGCSNLADVTKSIETAEPEFKTNIQIATEYIENKIKIDSMCNSRSAKSNDYPSFMSNNDIVDKEGNRILFDDFTEEEKQVFYSVWKEALLNSIVEKLDADDGLVEMMVFENEVFRMTEKNRSLLNTSPEMFLKNYQKNLKKLLKKNNAETTSRSSSASSGKKISNNCNVTSSYNKFKSNYKKGRLLICSDNTSSSGSLYIGHISMMHKDKCEDSWLNNSLARAAITSYPIQKPELWPDQSDGVQYEPIGLWVGNDTGSANKVSIYDVGATRWVWDWWKSHFEYQYASSSERNRAVYYAECQLGKPYSWDLLFQWHIWEFYCSSLCNAAWNYAGYCFSTGLWVTPSDIAASGYTKVICSYNNK